MKNEESVKKLLFADIAVENKNLKNTIERLESELSKLIKKEEAKKHVNLDIKQRESGNVVFYFTSPCGTHGADECIGEFEFTSMELFKMFNSISYIIEGNE